MDIVFVNSTDHNAYMDAATPEIKGDMVGASDAIPRDFNQEQVRTNIDVTHEGLLVFIVSYECLSFDRLKI